MRETMEAIRTLGFWTVLWYRTGYRPFMRLAHRYNWHHTTTCGPFPDGSKQFWCQWCGLRHSTPPIDYALSGCHRSHPHENMDAACEAKTLIARADAQRRG